MTTKPHLVTLCVILILLLPYGNGINYFYNMPMKEFVAIASCIADIPFCASFTSVALLTAAVSWKKGQNPDAYIAFFTTCNVPKYIALTTYYCIEKIIPEVNNVIEGFQAARKNKQLIADIYDCTTDIIPCITDYDRSIVMRDYEKCYRGLRDKYCKRENWLW